MDPFPEFFSYPPPILFLSDCYCGIDEHRLELALGLSALHFSILLRELRPYLMSASGIFYLCDQVRQAALKHFAESQPMDPQNPFLMKPESGRAFLRHDEVLVAEALFKVQALGDQATRTLVTDASFFVAAHHSTYRTRFRLAWSSLASDDVGGDMAAELRASAERYRHIYAATTTTNNKKKWPCLFICSRLLRYALLFQDLDHSETIIQKRLKKVKSVELGAPIPRF
jgi:hypothetical protein